MSRCTCNESNVARCQCATRNMYSQPDEIHEGRVARPLRNPNESMEKPGKLDCKNPTVRITRTRSGRGSMPQAGIVDSGVTRAVRHYAANRVANAPALQGFNLAPHSGHVGIQTSTTSNDISSKKTCNLGVELKYECRKKRKFVYFEKTKKFEPASQIELLNRENVGNSESYSTIDKARVCTNSDRTNTIRTDNNGIVIEELNKNPVDNPYHVPRSQEELRLQKAFTERLNRKRRKMENINSEKIVKTKLTATELKERRKKPRAKQYEKRKKELKNNRTLNSFIIPKTNLPEAE